MGGGVIEMLEDRRLLAAHVVATVAQHPPTTLASDAASPWVVRPADVAAGPVAAPEVRPLPGESGHPWVFQTPVSPTRGSQFRRTPTVPPTGGPFLTTARPPQSDGSPYLSYVNFTGGGFGATEGNPPQPDGFDVIRSSDSSDYPLTVNYTLTGTADYGSDYTVSPSPFSVTFAPGETSKHVTVTPISDGIDEGQETIDVTPVPDPNFNVQGSVNLVILAASVSFSPNPLTLSRPTTGRPVGSTTASLANARGGDYKIVSVSPTKGTTTPAAPTGAFTLKQPSVTAGLTKTTLTITYTSGAIPAVVGSYSYDLVIEDTISGAKSKLVVKI